MARPTSLSRTPRGAPAAAARGFTLIEAGIVLAVLAIVAGLGAPSLRDLVDTRRLLGAANLLAGDLRFIRAEAVARQSPLRLSLRPLADGSCYVIHTGAADGCDCAGFEGPARCTGGAVAIRTVRLAAADRIAVQANVGSLLYDPVRGTTTPTGTLKVVGAGSRRAVHHVVNLMGRVRSCSPNATVSGYRPC